MISLAYLVLELSQPSSTARQLWGGFGHLFNANILPLRGHPHYWPKPLHAHVSREREECHE